MVGRLWLAWSQPEPRRTIFDMAEWGSDLREDDFFDEMRARGVRAVFGNGAGNRVRLEGRRVDVRPRFVSDGVVPDARSNGPAKRLNDRSAIAWANGVVPA